MNEKLRQEEFLALYQPVSDSLNRFARAMAVSREDAKDLVSEAVMLGYENFHKLRDKKAFLSYMFTIISRLYKKSLKRKKYFGEYNEAIAENLRSNDTKPESGIDVEILYKALNRLPVKQKEAIILFEISGFTIEEIKKLQGGTISGVKSRLKRARETLSELLKVYEYKTSGIEKTQPDAFMEAELIQINKQAILN